MPLEAQAFHTLNDPELGTRIEALYESSPEFSSGAHALSFFKSALAKGDTLYLGMFNDKPVCAVAARGQGVEKTIQFIVVHPANRGRGLAQELIRQVCDTEQSYGVQRFVAGCGAIHRILHFIGRIDAGTDQ